MRNYHVKQLVVICVLAMALTLIACENPFAKDYMVTGYPNHDDLTKYKNLGHYNNLDEARDMAEEFMRLHPKGDYEIGINCKPYIGDVYTCEDTIQ